MSTFKEKPPEVRLISFTPNPLATLYEVWQRSRDYPLVPSEHTDKRREEEVRVFKDIVFEFTQIPEMVRFTWWIDGAPRAFFDQLVRHRKAAWFARSNRIKDVEGFSERKEYLTTPAIANEKIARTIYDDAMAHVDLAYRNLRSMDIPVEDARGLLPLHYRSGFAVSWTLRDLADIFRTRTCVILQQTYWAPIAKRIRKDLEAIDPELGVIFAPPCQRPEGTCLSPIEAKARVSAQFGAFKRRDLHPCKTWNEKFHGHPAERGAIESLVRDGKTRWAVGPLEAEDG